MSGAPMLCSFREAARLLGVGRNNTLKSLVRRGVLRPVVVEGREYIPLKQLEALAEHGENPSEPSAPKPPKRKRAAGGSIADLKL